MIPSLEQQRCIQPPWREDWFCPPRDQIAVLLEHTLLQDLPWYEARSRYNVYCPAQAS